MTTGDLPDAAGWPSTEEHAGGRTMSSAEAGALVGDAARRLANTIRTLEEPRMLGNGNEEVVEYWKRRALEAEQQLYLERAGMASPAEMRQIKPEVKASTFRQVGRW